MQKLISIFDPPTVGKAESSSKSGSHENLKLSRAEVELRKCLGNDTQEQLIKSYSCAWQREILVQGHLYVTANWFCFYSNILGWETKTCVRCRDIITIEKQKTAIVFPNAIMFATEDKQYGFSSFLHRNKTYQVLWRIWQNAVQDQPLPADELIWQLKQIKYKDSPLLKPKKSRDLYLKVPTVDYVDSSDPESIHPVDSNPPSPISSLPTERSPQVSLSTQAEVHPESTSPSRSSSQTTTTVTESLTDTFEDAPQETSTTGTTPSGSDAEAGSSSGDSEIDVPQKHVKKSPSLVALQHISTATDTEREVAEDVFRPLNGMVRQGSQQGPEDAFVGRERPKSCLHRLWGTVHPTRWSNSQGSVISWLQNARPQMCTPSNIINLLIVLSIILLVFSTVTMFCRLSYLNPSLRPYLPWQPWCQLCVSPSSGSYGNQPTPSDHFVLLTRAAFEDMVARHPEQSFGRSIITPSDENSKVP